MRRRRSASARRPEFRPVIAGDIASGPLGYTAFGEQVGTAQLYLADERRDDQLDRPVAEHLSCQGVRLLVPHREAVY